MLREVVADDGRVIHRPRNDLQAECLGLGYPFGMFLQDAVTIVYAGVAGFLYGLGRKVAAEIIGDGAVASIDELVAIALGEGDEEGAAEDVVLAEEVEHVGHAALLQLYHELHAGEGLDVGSEEVFEQGEGFAVAEGLLAEVVVVEVFHGEALVGGVVVDDEAAVTRLAHVELGAVDVELEGFAEGGNGVLGIF